MGLSVDIRPQVYAPTGSDTVEKWQSPMGLPSQEVVVRHKRSLVTPTEVVFPAVREDMYFLAGHHPGGAPIRSDIRSHIEERKNPDGSTTKVRVWDTETIVVRRVTTEPDEDGSLSTTVEYNTFKAGQEAERIRQDRQRRGTLNTPPPQNM